MFCIMSKFRLMVDHYGFFHKMFFFIYIFDPHSHEYLVTFLNFIVDGTNLFFIKNKNCVSMI